MILNGYNNLYTTGHHQAFLAKHIAVLHIYLFFFESHFYNIQRKRSWSDNNALCCWSHDWRNDVENCQGWRRGHYLCCGLQSQEREVGATYKLRHLKLVRSFTMLFVLVCLPVFKFIVITCLNPPWSLLSLSSFGLFNTSVMFFYLRKPLI